MRVGIAINRWSRDHVWNALVGAGGLTGVLAGGAVRRCAGGAGNGDALNTAGDSRRGFLRTDRDGLPHRERPRGRVAVLVVLPFLATPPQS